MFLARAMVSSEKVEALQNVPSFHQANYDLPKAAEAASLESEQRPGIRGQGPDNCVDTVLLCALGFVIPGHGVLARAPTGRL